MTKGAAVLILNCNPGAHLDTCLSSVLSQTERKEQAYLIDSGSVGDCVKHLRERCLYVKVICFDRNLGFAEVYNRVNRSMESHEFH
jgi:GT2 family glycosyltransferase